MEGGKQRRAGKPEGWRGPLLKDAMRNAKQKKLDGGVWRLTAKVDFKTKYSWQLTFHAHICSFFPLSCTVFHRIKMVYFLAFLYPLPLLEPPHERWIGHNAGIEFPGVWMLGLSFPSASLSSWSLIPHSPGNPYSVPHVRNGTKDYCFRVTLLWLPKFFLVLASQNARRQGRRFVLQKACHLLGPHPALQWMEDSLPSFVIPSTPWGNPSDKGQKEPTVLLTRDSPKLLASPSVYMLSIKDGNVLTKTCFLLVLFIQIVKAFTRCQNQVVQNAVEWDEVIFPIGVFRQSISPIWRQQKFPGPYITFHVHTSKCTNAQIYTYTFIYYAYSSYLHKWLVKNTWNKGHMFRNPYQTPLKYKSMEVLTLLTPALSP